MKLFLTIYFILSIVINVTSFSQTGVGADFQYISPLPDAEYVSPYTTIILKPGFLLEKSILSGSYKITVTGSKSGVHEGELILSKERTAIIFKPYQPFSYGEKVNVSIAENFVESIRAYDYSFTISNTNMEPGREAYNSLLSEIEIDSRYNYPAEQPSDTTWLISVNYKNAPSDGYFFLSPFHFPGTNPNYLMIMDNWGNRIFYQEKSHRSFDFKVLPDGRLSHYDDKYISFRIMDRSFNLVDSFYCKNGYKTDNHDLFFLDNGNVVMMSYDPQVVDMSQIVSGGQPDAVVIGLIIQEQDTDRNVVFEWRSWDHMQITEAADQINLTADTIDYAHGNAIDQDHDGHILISSRNLNEITKINRQTGDIIWRFGGKANMFTLTNDTRWFAHQHDIRKLDDSTYTIFDNSNHNLPVYSRAVAYRLDEANLTATKIYEYNNEQRGYSQAMGSFRRLPGGNYLIGLGSDWEPSLIELDETGNLRFEMSLPPHVMNYRALKFDFKTTYFSVSKDRLDFGFVELGADSVVRSFKVGNPNSDTLFINELYTTSNDFTIYAPDSLKLAPGQSQTVIVSFKPTNSRVYKENCLIRINEGNRIIAHDVLLTAQSIVGVEKEEGIPETFSLSQNYPNPFNPSTTICFGLPQTADVQVTVYNILGEAVQLLVSETLPAGNYSYQFNASEMPSGIYFYRLQTESFMETKKMLLIK